MHLRDLLLSFFNAEVAWRYLPDILAGLWTTLRLGIAISLTGVALGLALAVLRARGWRLINAALICVIDVLRALPPLVVIMVLFFAFPYIDISMSSFTATWLSLSLILAAFAEEIFWAGILSVPRGQTAAAHSLGLGWTRTMRHVVLPQALRLTVAPITNRIIAITKSTALGAVVGLSEVLNNAQSASSTAGNPTPLTLAALACLIIFVPIVLLGRWAETRFKWKR